MPRPARASLSARAWVIWACYLAIGAGTLGGGWRIVKTMGRRITKLKPVGGFCAVWAWVVTSPASVFVAAVFYWISFTLF